MTTFRITAYSQPSLDENLVTHWREIADLQDRVKQKALGEKAARVFCLSP